MSRPTLKPDGRQSETAAAIQRGVLRLLRTLDFSPVCEVPLNNGRRADVVGLSRKGEIWVIEIKSSVEDFRADHKWQDYLDFCDGFYFAVTTDFPQDILPKDTGLILADRYGGEIIRTGTIEKLKPARRRAFTLDLARTSALRLADAMDPDFNTQADRWRAKC